MSTLWFLQRASRMLKSCGSSALFFTTLREGLRGSVLSPRQLASPLWEHQGCRAEVSLDLHGSAEQFIKKDVANNRGGNWWLNYRESELVHVFANWCLWKFSSNLPTETGRQGPYLSGVGWREGYTLWQPCVFLGNNFKGGWGLPRMSPGAVTNHVSVCSSLYCQGWGSVKKLVIGAWLETHRSPALIAGEGGC